MVYIEIHQLFVYVCLYRMDTLNTDVCEELLQ